MDTPRPSGRSEETHFASLVVSLPVAHSGGELVLRPQPTGSEDGSTGGAVTFDLSHRTEGHRVPLSLRWAAFYTDVEHELLPVTAGHRLTLTYNLYGMAPLLFGRPDEAATIQLATSLRQLGASSSSSTTSPPLAPTQQLPSAEASAPSAPLVVSARADAAAVPLCIPSVAGAAVSTAVDEAPALADLLASPLLLPLGGTLAYHCQHLYPIHTRVLESRDNELLPMVLKGRDATFFAAAKASGFSTRVVPLLGTDFKPTVRQFQPVLRIPRDAAAEEGDPRPEVPLRWDREHHLQKVPVVPAGDEDSHCARVAAAVVEAESRVGEYDGDELDVLPGAAPLLDATRELQASGAAMVLGSTVPCAALRTCAQQDVVEMEEDNVSSSLEWSVLPTSYVPSPVVAVNAPAAAAQCEQYGRLTYGNEAASMEYVYSSAAVVLRVPAWEGRKARLA